MSDIRIYSLSNQLVREDYNQYIKYDIVYNIRIKAVKLNGA